MRRKKFYTKTKTFTLIFVTGCIYLIFEIFSRFKSGAMLGFSVANMTHSWASLAGWTSLWMIPIGGLCGYLLGHLNELGCSKKLPILFQALIGVLIVWGIEFCTGVILNVVFELGIWDYSTSWGNFTGTGQVTLESFPGFFVVSIFAFWLDDVLRFWNLKEERPKPLITYYKRLVLDFKRK